MSAQMLLTSTGIVYFLYSKPLYLSKTVTAGHRDINTVMIPNNETVRTLKFSRYSYISLFEVASKPPWNFCIHLIYRIILQVSFKLFYYKVKRLEN